MQFLADERIKYVIQNCITMLGRLVERDELLRYLLENSTLTDAQLDTLLSDLNGRALKEKIGLRDRTVSKGAFIRTLNQAKGNLRSSIFTLLLLGYLGYFGDEEVGVIFRLIDLLRRAKGRREVIKLIDGIVDKLVK